MGVYQRGRVWYIDYFLNGRRVRKAVGTSKKVAVLALQRIKVRKARHEFLGIKEPKKMIFDNLCDEYLEYSRTNNTTQSYRRNRTSIKNLLQEFSGRMIHEITVRDVENYKMLRVSKVKPATVNRELSCIKYMFNVAVLWEYLSDNPLRSIPQFKEPPGRIRYLQEEEVIPLLECCADHVRLIVITAINTGMRKGEILRLKWQDIDLRQRLIIVRNSKNNESRVLPINVDLYNTLITIGPQLPDEYVFTHSDGKPFRDIKDGFTAATKRAGIIDFRFHDLRHTYAVYLAKNGTPLIVLQKLLGHKTITMTMRYAQFTDQRLFKREVDKLRFSAYNDIRRVTNMSQLAITKK